MTTAMRPGPVLSPLQTAVPGPALVVANPAAAGVTPSLVDGLARRVAAATGGVHVVWTGRVGEAGELAVAAADARIATVVAVGGDGTVREVAEGIAQAATGRPSGGPVLLAVPAGSGNSTCRNLWGEAGWREVLDLALDPARAAVRHLDLLGLVEPGVKVVLGASSGFLAQVLMGARRVAGVQGRDRYMVAAADVLADMPSHPTRVIVDGRVVHDGPASLAAVGGGRFRASAFQFLPASRLDDGLLDVCVIDALSGPAVGELAALVPSGAHLGRPEVSYCRGRRVVIERTDGQALVAEFDGEVWAEAGCRLTVEVLPAALAALAPRHPPAG